MDAYDTLVFFLTDCIRHVEGVELEIDTITSNEFECKINADSFENKCQCLEGILPFVDPFIKIKEEYEYSLIELDSNKDTYEATMRFVVK
jgi:hypothetical protein